MGIGSRIDQLIRARGKRPGTLAREAGVSKNTVYSIIKRDNDKVDPAILSRLAHALGVPLSALYGAEEPLPSHPDILPVTTQRVPMLGSIAAASRSTRSRSYTAGRTTGRRRSTLRCGAGAIP